MSTATNIIVNGQHRELNGVDPATPLLWALRDHLGLVGTKFGCGGGYCGACTVHINGNIARACITTLASVAGKEVITIEGLANQNGSLHPLQQAWIDHDVPQCGYCQPGQIMSAAALLAATSIPSDREIDIAMSGNVCRCGTYQRIRKAIRATAKKTAGEA